jgi:hypothetical protein
MVSIVHFSRKRSLGIKQNSAQLSKYQVDTNCKSIRQFWTDQGHTSVTSLNLEFHLKWCNLLYCLFQQFVLHSKNFLEPLCQLEEKIFPR